ncbi:Prolyl oligopeptidase family protein [Winogradskyella psychrotolerans RS-3]|uniref:Prolyl oligopeptidase family protein n=1 Tax=Winogradskyella psychrotolerans RS-3 TaxID=641526 RepID=S7WZA0_9FLAO|nr:Prolyl oligopeptidase family protein [Winogradskyella psychrotolerans RS-3]
MTPELLWQVERLSVMGLDSEGSTLFFIVKTPNISDNSYDSKYFKMPVDGGTIVEIKKEDVKATDKNVSTDGNHELYNAEVQIEAIKGTDVYKNLDKSDVYIFSDLDIRHWDTWSDGSFNHLFYKKVGSEDATGIDIMPNEPYHTPQKPFGGDEDYIWSPDSKAIYYVSKKLKVKPILPVPIRTFTNTT